VRPLLSIIIPYYNHPDSLPVLLDSIEAQRFDDYEIIIVDDCSDQPCDAEAQRRRKNGGELRLLKNPQRLYTKETRLRGVEAAQGEYIMFADADDRLYGKHALKRNMESIISSKADLLQFRALVHDPANTHQMWSYMSMPWPGIAADREIFARYVRGGMFSHFVWGKIAPKALWCRCLEPARQIKIRRYQEDLLLSSLLYLHARSFVGSEHIGYERQYIDKNVQKACGRVVANYLMLTGFIPYARSIMEKDPVWLEAGDEKETILSLAGEKFREWLNLHLLIYLSAIIHGQSSMDEIKQHIEEEKFMRIIETPDMLYSNLKTLVTDVGLIPGGAGLPRMIA
jgi:glycosyltransferase involved in cell wall biosynthesis